MAMINVVARVIFTLHYYFFLPCEEEKPESSCVKYWESSQTTSAHPVGAGAVSEPSILAGEPSGLLMRTAMMAKGLSFGQMKGWQHFLNLRGSRTY